MAGSFGTVHRADWNGSVSVFTLWVFIGLFVNQRDTYVSLTVSPCFWCQLQDVAVKVFIEQDYLEDRLDEFVREVSDQNFARLSFRLDFWDF